MIPRSAHRAYARAFNYFWLPCPLCGRMTGGHEWNHPGRSITYEATADHESAIGYCNDHPPGSYGPLLWDPKTNKE